ncbi:MAG: phosphodiester glycosidase family protein [Kofleriaceae bacterium]
MSLASLFTIAPAGGSFTMRFLAVPLCVTFVVACIAAGRHHRRTLVASIAAAFVLATTWAALYLWRPRWLVLALEDPRGAVVPSDFVWTERAPGLDTTEIAIDLGGERVDSIALVRIDLARYRFSVHWDASGSRPIDVWQRELGAAVVINGSYFEPDHSPSTPLRIAGAPVGPTDYTSTHGALVIDDGAVDIVDLRGRDLAGELARHREAMVSYPLLVDPSGRSRAAGHDDWFANRVFVALDTSGRIVIGTTRTGFFSLRRLGDTLERADRLSLRVALNLDGGPLASQIVSVPGYTRTVLGDAEVTGGHDVLRLAYQRIRHARGQHIGLPIVLAARAR